MNVPEFQVTVEITPNHISLRFYIVKNHSGVSMCTVRKLLYIDLYVFCQEPVEELLCSRSEWHMSHTRTGRG